jgi:hypothetical protein
LPPRERIPKDGSAARFLARAKQYPRKSGDRGIAWACWKIIARQLGEDELDRRVGEHLAWKIPAAWSDGIGPKDFERYLWGSCFDEEKPAADELAAAAEQPTKKPHWQQAEAERKAAAAEAEERRIKRLRDAEEAEQREPKLDRAAEVRKAALDRTDFHRDPTCWNFPWRPLSDAFAAKIWQEVMLERLADLRAAGKAIEDYPRIFREFLAAHPEAAPPPPSPPPIAEPSDLHAGAARSSRRPWIRANSWPPPFSAPSPADVTVLARGKPGTGKSGLPDTLHLVNAPSPNWREATLLPKRAREVETQVEAIEKLIADLQAELAARFPAPDISPPPPLPPDASEDESAPGPRRSGVG